MLQQLMRKYLSLAHSFIANKAVRPLEAVLGFVLLITFVTIASEELHKNANVSSVLTGLLLAVALAIVGLLLLILASQALFGPFSINHRRLFLSIGGAILL